MAKKKAVVIESVPFDPDVSLRIVMRGMWDHINVFAPELLTNGFRRDITSSQSAVDKAMETIVNTKDKDTANRAIYEIKEELQHMSYIVAENLLLAWKEKHNENA